MEIILKAGIFKDGNLYALQVILDENLPTEKRTAVPFPTPQSPSEAAKSLHELATWIEQESRNVP